MQSNKKNVIKHIAEVFYRKYSNVIPFVNINSFINNCNLIAQSFSVTVTDYSYIFLWLNYVILLLLSSYSPTQLISNNCL